MKNTWYFTIWYHSELVVHMYFTSFEEAWNMIEQWPWKYSQDDCSCHLFQEVELGL
jgi:hypothetical protein